MMDGRLRSYRIQLGHHDAEPDFLGTETCGRMEAMTGGAGHLSWCAEKDERIVCMCALKMLED